MREFMIQSDLIDIGLNLSHDSFDADRDAVVARAREAGVRRMLVTGSSLPSSARAIELAATQPSILRATAGVHPHHAADLTESGVAELRALAAAAEVLAVGECGLDYFRDFSPRAAQRDAFARQIALAHESGKPLFLHQRDAHEDFIAILDEAAPAPLRGVAHCFTDTRAAAKAYLDRGLHIGITGWICDERRGSSLRESVRYVPRDRLLIETDAPYLLPRNLAPRPKSRRNEPMYLPAVLEMLATCRGEDRDELGAATTMNALRLFDWPRDEHSAAQADQIASA
jgi:TatD DNase family protein